MSTSNRNPITSGIGYQRATPEEKIEAWRQLRDDEEVMLLLKMPLNVEKPKLVHIAETIDEAQKHVAEDGQIIGVQTGYEALDEIFQGLREGEVHVVFGDTGHGKSQLVQSIAYEVASRDVPVLFIGTEMINRENTNRFASFSDMDWDKVAQLPIIYPQDIPKYTDLDGLLGEAKQNGIQLIIIDLLDEIEKPAGMNEAQAIATINSEIKRVAIRHELPIILACHTNRDKDRRGIPRLADIYGSSSTAKIASSAVAVWRDENIEPELRTLKLVCRKHRRGIKRHSAELNILPNARLQGAVSIQSLIAGQVSRP